MEDQLKDETRIIRYPSGNYAIWFIKEIISKMEAGAERQEILLTYQIKPGTLDEWVKNHASIEYKSKHKQATPQIRNSVVRAVAEGRMTVEEARIACNITAVTIKRWIKAYQQQGNNDIAASNLAELSKKKPAPKANIESEQIKLLQQQLADAQLKIAALNILIDVAEDQLKINIRKKPGAKQS